MEASGVNVKRQKAKRNENDTRLTGECQDQKHDANLKRLTLHPKKSTLWLFQPEKRRRFPGHGSKPPCPSP